VSEVTQPQFNLCPRCSFLSMESACRTSPPFLVYPPLSRFVFRACGPLAFHRFFKDFNVPLRGEMPPSFLPKCFSLSAVHTLICFEEAGHFSEWRSLLPLFSYSPSFWVFFSLHITSHFCMHRSLVRLLWLCYLPYSLFITLLVQPSFLVFKTGKVFPPPSLRAVLKHHDISNLPLLAGPDVLPR